ncbi:MAG: glycoside hydrolase family 5 protein, partial [Lachnospiraceae bacterium]|nr:glycoside hydrolase family 5 protein [Lachnospiraceae bacterium]
MKAKRFFSKALAGVLTVGLLFSNVNVPVEAAVVEGTGATQTVSAQMPFRELTADEMVAEMGTGWNLGNTMDGHTGFTPNETLWQNVETTQELIKAVHDAGFNTVRIPVTWGTMIDDANGYAIDDKWMSRVQDIVDYCINMNMYVIINIHHDGAEQSGWLRVGAEDLAPVKEKYAAVWTHIAERFKDYDEHLIFESMNEVVGPEDTIEGIVKDTQVIMELNQIFVDSVRATGSNNAVRWLSVPGRYTNITNMT